MLTDKERQLIIALRRSEVDNVHQVAKKSNTPKSTLYDLLHRLEEKEIIKTHVAIAFEKIGYPLRIFFIAKTSAVQKELLKKYLLNQKNINTIHTVNRGNNFHFEALFRNQKEVEEFLEQLEEHNALEQLSAYNVLETLQHEQFLTAEEHFQ